ncbi:MAG TPA: choice-of-anchor D domain-containing protein, partial [Terriglobales bacterium]
IPDPVLSATLAPASADFGTLILTHSSTGQQFTVTNTGEGVLAVNSISVGTDYAETNDCGASIAIGGSCHVNVVFTPTTVGAHNVSLTVNLSSGTYTSALTGTGRDALLSATLTPSTAAFGSVIVNKSSTAKSFTLTNNGEADLTVTSIAVGTDYSQTNNCGTSLVIGASCTVNVVFTPTAGGARNGTLTVTLSGNTYTASLTGTGLAPDFAVAGVSGTSLIVPQGNTGTISLKFTPSNQFTGTVTLACNPAGTAPAGVTCTVPAPFTMDGTTVVTQVVTFQTTPLYTASNRTPASKLPWQGTLAIAIVGVVVGSRSRKVRMQLLLLVMLAIAFFAVGCGSSNSPSKNPNGTATGTYSYTVTATSGAVSHSQTVTLIVQ